MILSLGPKKLRTKFFQNKGIVPKRKDFGPFFFILPSTAEDEFFCWARQGILANLLQVIRPFPEHPEGCGQQNVLKKSLIIRWKTYLIFFLLELSVRNLRERFVRVHRVLWNLCCKSCGRYRIISLVPKRLLRTHNFEKKTQPIQWNYNFGLIFSRGIEYDERQVTIYIGPQHVLTTTLLVIGSFL